MKTIYLVLLFLLLACISHAETTQCTTSINGEIRTINYDDEENELFESYSLREMFFKGWGDLTCPSFITLRELTPELSDLERSVFCLQFDKDQKTYTGYVNGDRDAYLNCKKPSKTFCERVKDSKDAAIAITGIGAGAVGGASTAASVAGVSAVAHSSGAVILTGTSGYIAGTLGSIGAGAISILTSPVTLATATVSVVAVGGAIYYCREK